MESFEEYPHFFEVQLAFFEGPIDLLLHLVKRNELEIESLALAEVASQYLHCLEQMRQFDLEVAGEYLVMAATLLSIKSSYLLNEPVELVEDEEGNMVDPREELLRKLREAEVYKDGAVELGKRPVFGIDVFSAPSLLGGVKAPPVGFKDHDPMLLGAAFRKLLERVDDDPAKYNITLESVSIVDRMMGVLEQLKTVQGPIVFHKLIPDLTSRGSIIGTFIALLELCKRQAIVVRQDESFEDIVVEVAFEKSEELQLTSEFDEVVAGNGEGNGELAANGPETMNG